MLDWINKTFKVEQIAITKLVLSVIASLLFAVIFFQILRRTENRVKKNDGKYVERMLLSAENYMTKTGRYESIKL